MTTGRRTSHAILDIAEYDARAQRRSRSRRKRVVLGGLALALCACAPDHAVAVGALPNSRIEVAVGSEIRVMLGTVGPGEYVSPPTLSSTRIRFLDVTPVGPFVPAGARQLFRLRAVAAGRSIIAFHHSVQGVVVTDTVDVR